MNEKKNGIGANAAQREGIRRPEVARLAASLQRKNPSWSKQRALEEAKAQVTAPRQS